AEDGIRDFHVTGVQTCALPISPFSVKVRLWSALSVTDFTTYGRRCTPSAANVAKTPACWTGCTDTIPSGNVAALRCSGFICDLGMPIFSAIRAILSLPMSRPRFTYAVLIEFWVAVTRLTIP